MKAVTEIRHGSVDKDGNNVVKVIKPGESVSGLSKDEVQSLRNAGVVTDEKSADEMTEAERAEQRAKLEDQLAELTAAAPVETPGDVAEKFARERAQEQHPPKTSEAANKTANTDAGNTTSGTGGQGTQGSN